jgi:hypothetical protein
MQNALKEVTIPETNSLTRASKPGNNSSNSQAFKTGKNSSHPGASIYAQNSSTEEMIHRAAKRSVLIPVAFLLCWTPYLCMVLSEIITNNPSTPSFDYFALFCCSMTTIVDFFIFAFLNEKFNKGIRELFGYKV